MRLSMPPPVARLNWLGFAMKYLMWSLSIILVVLATIFMALTDWGASPW